MRRLGVCLSSAVLLALAACGIRYGFAGGGLPAHVRTMAVLPFENETTSPELQSELHEQMRTELRRRLGVREATQDRADALVRGVIRDYQPDVPVAYSANPNQAVSARRRVMISVDIEILDQTTNRVLFERRGLRAEGEYAERAEPEGRREAILRLVNDVVEGAQSQW
jgi:hypothetical protein